MAADHGGLDYRSTGVDIDAGDALVQAIRSSVAATHGPEVLRGLGHFGGFFNIGATSTGTTLVASADGVGTKLKVAVLADFHDHIGEDIVNHCLNDLLACGASPLFFLDYFATGSLDARVGATVINSIARACKASGVALLGGETAEMPGIYADGDYDLAGFIVGVVDRDEIIDGSHIQPGDVIFGLESNGFHTNGYSLIRAALGLNGDTDVARDRLRSTVGYAADRTVAEVLLEPHRSYLDVIRPALASGAIRGMAHITGGGLPGNVSRVVPSGLTAEIDPDIWTVPPVFDYVIERGNVERKEAFRVFNMGIGFVVVAAESEAAGLKSHVPELIEIGRIARATGSEQVILEGIDR
jgi:phosphoribosylformylglycinamidine cyclo-ligase